MWRYLAVITLVFPTLAVAQTDFTRDTSAGHAVLQAPTGASDLRVVRPKAEQPIITSGIRRSNLQIPLPRPRPMDLTSVSRAGQTPAWAEYPFSLTDSYGRVVLRASRAAEGNTTMQTESGATIPEITALADTTSTSLARLETNGTGTQTAERADRNRPDADVSWLADRPMKSVQAVVEELAKRNLPDLPLEIWLTIVVVTLCVLRLAVRRPLPRDIRYRAPSSAKSRA